MRTTADLPCQEFVELVTAYLDEVLPPDLRASVESHLELCDGCRLYLGQMRLTVGVLRRVRGDALEALPADTRQRLLDRFRAWRDRRAG